MQQPILKDWVTLTSSRIKRAHLSPNISHSIRLKKDIKIHPNLEELILTYLTKSQEFRIPVNYLLREVQEDANRFCHREEVAERTLKETFLI